MDIINSARYLWQMAHSLHCNFDKYEADPVSFNITFTLLLDKGQS